MSWFTEDYKVPSKSGYTKFVDGDNKFRFLLPPAMGNELWMGGKPTRRHLNETFTETEKKSADINKFTGNPKEVQHFWACIVWNYKTNAIEILNITQQDIQRELLALAKKPIWGSLDTFDVNIVRTKLGQQTKYSVQPEPHTPMAKPIKDAIAKINVDMEKYFSGGNPIEVVEGGAPKEDDIDDILEEAQKGQ